MENNDFSLGDGEPACAGLIRISDAVLRDAIAQAGDSSGDREESVHAVRTAIKRVRAALRLLRPALGEDVFRAEDDRFRKAAQTLSPLRDSAVGRKTLGQLAECADGKKLQRDLPVVQQHYSEQIAAPEAAEQERLLGEAVQMLEANRQRLSELSIAVADWKVVESGLEEVYRAARRRMKRAFENGQDDSFHAWRIRLKNLFYELQMLEPLWPKHLRSMIDEIKKVQEKIGDDHDLAVLKAELQKSPQRFGGGKVVKRVVGHLKKRSRKLREDCQPIAKEVLRQKPGKFIRKLEKRRVKQRHAASAPASTKG